MRNRVTSLSVTSIIMPVIFFVPYLSFESAQIASTCSTCADPRMPFVGVVPWSIVSGRRGNFYAKRSAINLQNILKQAIMTKLILQSSSRN